jgi:hypothetical protein
VSKVAVLPERQIEIPFSPLPWVYASGYDMERREFLHERAGFYESGARFRMVCGGRRLSKTMHAVPEFLRMALERQEGVGWWVGNMYKTTKKAWRFWRKIRPQELVADESKTELYTMLKNGTQVFFMSAETPDALVSEGLDFVACDELHLWDETVYESCIQPALIDKRGRSIGIFNARNNFTKRYYHNGRDPLLTAWDSWKFPTYANSALSSEQIDEANGRVTVMLSIFGRSTPVDIEYWQIESV